MDNTNSYDDGLYDLIDVDDKFENGSETCRTEDLLFNNNCIDWNRMRVRGNDKSSNQNDSNTFKDDKLKESNSLGSGSFQIAQSLDALSARSKLINSRAEVNMGIYLPRNLRTDFCNGSVDRKYSLCNECNKKNINGVGWCLFCGALIIGHKRNEQIYQNDIKKNESFEEVEEKHLNVIDATELYNRTTKWKHVDIEEINVKVREKIDTEVKLDLVEFDTVRTNGKEDWDFDLEIDEDRSSTLNSNANHTAIVPPLDLSGLDSSRPIHTALQINNVLVDDSKENIDKPTRKWASSSTAWVDIPQNLLQKKPAAYNRNKLNSCTNKIGITIYRTGMEDESEEVNMVKVVKNVTTLHKNDGQFCKENATTFVTQPRVIIDRNYHNQNNSNVSQWQCLPMEIWLKIAAYLNHHQLSRLQQTCRRLYSIGLDSSLWRNINLYRHGTLSNDHIFNIAMKTPKELHFKNCFGTNITSDGLVEMFKICGLGLIKISFISCSKGAFEDDQFLVLSSNFCPNVTHIEASYLMNLRDDTLTKMIEGFTKIESLKIMGGHSISNKSIKSLIEHHRTSIINLDLYGCFKLNSSTLSLLEECLNLRSLALGSINNLKRSALIDMLRKLSQLTILDLRGTMNLVDDLLLEKICQSCPKLQQIILTNSCRLTDQGVIGLAKSCVSNSLKILDICGCSKITEKGLEEVLKQCHELEEIDISCTGIKGDGAKYFKMYAPSKLKCLHINNNKFISTDELLSLIRSCKKLATLSMCGTTSIGSWRSIEEQFPHVTFKHE